MLDSVQRGDQHGSLSGGVLIEGHAIFLIPWRIGKCTFVHAGPINFPDSADSQKGSLNIISILVLVAMSGVGRLTGPSEKQLQCALLPGIVH